MGTTVFETAPFNHSGTPPILDRVWKSTEILTEKQSLPSNDPTGDIEPSREYRFDLTVLFFRVHFSIFNIGRTMNSGTSMDQKVTVLVAEDDKEVATTLIEELTHHGYDAALAMDGEQALSKLIERKFDVVILDLKMPKVGGFAILKYIKSTAPTTRVIVLTAYADLKNTEECKKLGADHVIGKPYDLELLFWTLELVTKK